MEEKGEERYMKFLLWMEKGVMLQTWNFFSHAISSNELAIGTNILHTFPVLLSLSHNTGLYFSFIIYLYTVNFLETFHHPNSGRWTVSEFSGFIFFSFFLIFFLLLQVLSPLLYYYFFLNSPHHVVFVCKYRKLKSKKWKMGIEILMVMYFVLSWSERKYFDIRFENFQKLWVFSHATACNNRVQFLKSYLIKLFGLWNWKIWTVVDIIGKQFSHL